MNVARDEGFQLIINSSLCVCVCVSLSLSRSVVAEITSHSLWPKDMEHTVKTKDYMSL
jgi:hypothetical protein